MTNIFILILNYNREKDTIECLKSVEKIIISDFKLNIVVVDNGSRDGSIKRLKEYIKPKENIVLLENKKNLGFCAGNNVGINYALEKNADYILVLNNDTVVDEKLIVNLLKVVRKNSKVGVFSPKIYFEKGFEFHKERYKKSKLGKIIWYAGGKIDWNNVYASNRGVDKVDKGQYKKNEKTDFASGACMLLNTKALKEVGGFDEKYYMYFEDTDLSMRMRNKNWQVMFVPSAFLWHKVAQSSAIGSDLNDYFLSRNRMIFGMQYAPIRTKLALIKESFKLLLRGRRWQKIAIKDFYLGIFQRGSWKD